MRPTKALPEPEADCPDTSGRIVISELDVWRAANLLIRQHGENAELEAARKADVMLDRGDRDGQLVWMRIRRAIVELQAAPSGPAH
jgi:hypothetical protein